MPTPIRCDLERERLTAKEFLLHLGELDERFLSNLSGRVDLEDYANKLAGAAEFIVARMKTNVVGVCVFYPPNVAGQVYVTHLGVSERMNGRGVGSALVNYLVNITSGNAKEIVLSADSENLRVLNFYMGLGFKVSEKDEGRSRLIMSLASNYKE